MARAPRLAVLGTAPTAIQMRVAADRLGWKAASHAAADLVYVTSGATPDPTSSPDPGVLFDLAESGAHLALDIDVVVELGAETLTDLHVAATGSVRRGEPIATAPAVRQWLGTVRAIDDLTHLSGRCLSPPLDTSLIAVALHAARTARWRPAGVSRAETSDERLVLRLEFTAPAARRTVDLAIGGREHDLPEWELQAAGPSRVSRVALLPIPRVEINGTETDLPEDHPAAAFGQEDFLRLWWKAVRAGRPSRDDPAFAATLCAAASALRA